MATYEVEYQYTVTENDFYITEADDVDAAKQNTHDYVTEEFPDLGHITIIDVNEIKPAN